VLERFTWAKAAEGTAARYREAIASVGRGRRGLDAGGAESRSEPGHKAAPRQA
jgi:hypothetical protein